VTVNRSGAAVVAFFGGMALGAAVWSRQLDRCRRDLFGPSPFRRLAALGYLGGRPGASSTRLLSDYVRWETNPYLRRRARRLLDRVSTTNGR
jgi:hypothetical protein